VHPLINPLNAKLYPICHLLALLGAQHILHVSRIRVNDLWDHDAQIITLWNIFNSVPRHVFFFTRKINNYSISKFTSLLSYENWEDVFSWKNVNKFFNDFLNTFLRIFYLSFSVIKLKYS